jgi:hypothetical protein
MLHALARVGAAPDQKRKHALMNAVRVVYKKNIWTASPNTAYLALVVALAGQCVEQERDEDIEDLAQRPRRVVHNDLPDVQRRLQMNARKVDQMRMDRMPIDKMRIGTGSAPGGHMMYATYVYLADHYADVLAGHVQPGKHAVRAVGTQSLLDRLLGRCIGGGATSHTQFGKTCSEDLVQYENPAHRHGL